MATLFIYTQNYLTWHLRSPESGSNQGNVVAFAEESRLTLNGIKVSRQVVLKHIEKHVKGCAGKKREKKKQKWGKNP